MATRSLNKVLLIGNLVRDPEIRYTPQNTAVANFSIATNRTWQDTNGQVQENVEYTRVVAWGKLAEIVGQICKKGRKVYVEGRLQTREWETKEGENRKTTEVVAEQLIALDSKGAGGEDFGSNDAGRPDEQTAKSSSMEASDSVGDIDDLADDIPF